MGGDKSFRDRVSCRLGWLLTHCVAEDDGNFDLLPHLLVCAAIIDVYHHAWLYVGLRSKAGPGACKASHLNKLSYIPTPIQHLY